MKSPLISLTTFALAGACFSALFTGGEAFADSPTLALTPPDIHLPARPLDFHETFDDTVGLWVQPRAGHTRPVAKLTSTHSGRVAANRLFVAAYLDALDLARGTQVLLGLRGLQVVDGSSQHGCMRTYYEEPAPIDTNASFFIGLSLIALDRTAAQRLQPEGQALLKDILADLAVWFAHEAKGRAFHYPNKHMGDLVCAWLLQETISTDSPEALQLADIMREARVYWRDNAWGWGEHMSDNYSGVLLGQLSTLLMFSRRLPADLRTGYTELFHELLAIEDEFAGGPRVPAIRSYAGKEISRIPKYRDNIKPLSQQSAENIRKLFTGDTTCVTADIFYRLGWDRLAGPPAAPRERVEIPCYGGSVARAWVTPGARLGTLSRYPIMPNTDGRDWGLSWQTMPVAFAAGADGWGFLRWHAQEDGKDRFHPALGFNEGYLDTSLSRTAPNPIVGLTHSLQDGPDALIVRTMPTITPSWETLGDQIVFTGRAFTVVREERDPKVSRLLLDAAGSPVTVFYLPLGPGAMPELSSRPGNIVWQAAWDRANLKDRDHTTGVWIICWGRDVATPPTAVKSRLPSTPGGESWQITWPHAQGVTPVTYAPAAADPLTR